MKGDRSSVFYGTLLLTASGLFSQVLGFLYRIALSRLIGAEVMGLYQLIMPVYSVLSSLTVVGLTVAASTLAAEYHALGNRGAVRRVRGVCLGLFFALMVPLALVTALCSDPISVYLLGDARTRLGLVLLLPCLLLTGVENLQKHCFFGMGLVRPPALAEMAEQVIRTAAVLGMLVLFLPQNPERTVGIIVLGMVVCEVFSAAALTLLFRKYVGRGKGERLPGLTRRVGAIALPVGVTAVLGNLMGSANAVLIPQKLTAGGATVSEAMSAFGVMSGMTIPMLALPSAIIGALSLVLMPRLAEYTATGRSGEVARQLGGTIRAVSLLLLPVMTLLTVVGPTLGAILFHEPTVGGFIIPLAAGMLLACYQSVLSSALNGIGKQTAAARNAILSGVVQLGFTWFTVEDWGLGGYVAGVVVSGVVGLALNWRDARRYTGIRAELFQWLTAPGLGSLLMGLCVHLVFRVLTDRGMTAAVASLICVLFGAALYLAALQAQGVLGWSHGKKRAGL